MARPARARGPCRDPRLVERQGDVLGPSSVLLVVLMVCAVVAMGALVVGIGRLMSTPGSASLPTSLPRRIAPAAVAPTPEPSLRPPPMHPAVGRPRSRRTCCSSRFGDSGADRRASASRSARVTRRVRRLSGASGGVEAASRVDAGCGSRSRSGRPRRRPTMAAAGRSLDANGKRHRWTGAGAPNPALGAGTLDAGRATDRLPGLLRPLGRHDQVSRAPGRRCSRHRGACPPVMPAGGRTRADASAHTYAAGMSTPTILPYGSWPSPITLDLVLGRRPRLAEPWLDGIGCLPAGGSPRRGWPGHAAAARGRTGRSRR